MICTATKYCSDEFKKNEIVEACRTSGVAKICIQGFGGET